MENDKVIIDYDRHKELLEAEENWLKYKEEHMYAGVVAAVVRSQRGYGEIKIDIHRDFTPNTPEEVKQELIKQADRLNDKVEKFHEEMEAKHQEFVEYTREKYSNIPNWIQNIFI